LTPPLRQYKIIRAAKSSGGFSPISWGGASGQIFSLLGGGDSTPPPKNGPLWGFLKKKVLFFPHSQRGQIPFSHFLKRFLNAFKESLFSPCPISQNTTPFPKTSSKGDFDGSPPFQAPLI